MNKTIRRGGIFLAVAALGVTLTACSTYAAPDQIILYYTAGTGESRQFQECIQPGQSGSYPVDDEIYALPTSLRTWNIRPKGGDTADPIASGTLPETVNGASQPGPEVVVYATADFYLNSDCKAGTKSPIVRFWESTGRRYGISADGEDGFNQGNFNKMLLNTLVPAEETALRQETRKYDADALDANTGNVWTTMERNLAPTFQRTLEDKLGGKYFCGTGFAGGAEVEWTEWRPKVKNSGSSMEEQVLDANGQPVYEEKKVKGTCPPVRITITDVNFKDSNIAAARARAYAAEQDANAKRIEAQGEADRAAILEGVGNSPGYVRLQEIEAQKQAAEACKVSKNCTVIIGDPGNTSLPVGGR
ncbi:hypothetical protein [Actinophytocola sp.]|uniref:hypothetical protein n=1 Tax=Actinophytocola sp. TaxID=1872138 RepID=UPI002D80F706|nr:hypothetical protein [Actinophytocola sp.]HET9144096.1 hypothetical protein [Actinophytocola sp.]